jgi:hypothetical protein
VGKSWGMREKHYLEAQWGQFFQILEPFCFKGSCIYISKKLMAQRQVRFVLVMVRKLVKKTGQSLTSEVAKCCLDSRGSVNQMSRLSVTFY